MSTIQDLVTSILLRTTSHADLTTKGSQLTFAEGDAVVIGFYEFLKDMVSGSSIAPYNAGTTYTGTQYVSYAGNIYVHISGTPTTGVTPGTNPAKWELSSVGALMHVRNQDTHLAYGTASEVSASDLRLLLDAQYIQVTEAGFQTLIDNVELSQNAIYEITDHNLSTSKILIQMFGSLSFSPFAILSVRVPKLSALSGIWNPVGTYAVNAYVAYSGEVYKNLTGTNDANTAPSADGTNWQLQDKTVSSRYETQFFGAEVSFDGIEFTINKVYDRYYGNTYGRILTGTVLQPFVINADALNNLLDAESNFDGVCNFRGSVTNNVLIASQVVSNLGGNVEGGGFTQNKLINTIITYTGSNNGEFTGNVLQGVALTFSDGHDTTKSISASRFEFAGQQSLSIRSDASFTGKTVNIEGSNIQDTIVMTGLATVDLATNGDPDVYGEIILSSTNPTETVNTFSNGARIFPIKIMSESGLTVTLNCTAYASVAAHGKVIAPSASYSINGSRGDYVILEPVTVGAYNCYRVKSSNLAL